MWFAIIAPCLFIALWFTRDTALEWYFAANFVQVVLCWLALFRWRYDSLAYAWIFSVLVVLIFIAALPVMWQCIYWFPYPNRKWLFALSLFLACLLFRIAKHDHPMGRNEWIEYLNGSADVFLGFSAMVGAAYLKVREDGFWKAALVFGVLLLGQAYYEYGFSLHLQDHDWIALNEWMPSLILALGSLLLAWMARRTSEPLPEPDRRS